MRITLLARARFCAALTSLVLLSSLAQAQYSGNVQGFVLDPSGAAVAGASVTLNNVDTGVENVGKTSDSGNYRFSSLPPGNYRVSAESGGFKRTEVAFILSTGQTQGIDIHVTLAGASSAVTVTTEAAALDVDENRIQATLSATAVRDLPSANRNLWDVLAVTPGVVGTGTRGAGESPGGGADNFGTQTPQLSANGRSYTGNLVMVDGMNVTSPIQNGNIILAPVPDAVQEATLQANSWDAENSLGSSILIQVTTKSGTNQFHGTGNLFYNNQDLQAHSDFQTVVPKFQRKDLVGALGGPIVKNKTFFFADFEKLWSKQPPVANTVFFEDPAFVQWAQTVFSPKELAGVLLSTSVCFTNFWPLPRKPPRIRRHSGRCTDRVRGKQLRFGVSKWNSLYITCSRSRKFLCKPFLQCTPVQLQSGPVLHSKGSSVPQLLQ